MTRKTTYCSVGVSSIIHASIIKEERNGTSDAESVEQ